MGDEVSRRTNQVKFFGKKLEDLLMDEGKSVKEAAEASWLSIPYLTNIIKGRRAPTFTVLRKLAAGLGLPFEDIAYLLVVGNGYKPDKSGRETMLVWRMNDGRGLSAGTLVKVDKADIMAYYPQYDDCNAKYYMKQYIRDVLYREALSKPMESVTEAEDNSDLIQDITENLSTLDRKSLYYIKALIQLYIKHYKEVESIR